jgi:hypothetical protein
MKPHLKCLAVASLLLANSPTGAAELRCDRFEVKAALDGSELTAFLDTDCPDFAEIMVSVSRSYYQDGSDEEYAHSYYTEKGTVGKWREPRRISVAHSEWARILEAHQKKMSRVGMGYNVERVEDELEMSIVLPVNQSDTRFGARNENLLGDAVKQKGLRIVESRVTIPYPLSDTGKIIGVAPEQTPLQSAFVRLSEFVGKRIDASIEDPSCAAAEEPGGYCISELPNASLSVNFTAAGHTRARVDLTSLADTEPFMRACSAIISFATDAGEPEADSVTMMLAEKAGTEGKYVDGKIGDVMLACSPARTRIATSSSAPTSRAPGAGIGEGEILQATRW